MKTLIITPKKKPILEIKKKVIDLEKKAPWKMGKIYRA